MLKKKGRLFFGDTIWSYANSHRKHRNYIHNTQRFYCVSVHLYLLRKDVPGERNLSEYANESLISGDNLSSSHNLLFLLKREKQFFISGPPTPLKIPLIKAIRITWKLAPQSHHVSSNLFNSSHDSVLWDHGYTIATIFEATSSELRRWWFWWKLFQLLNVFACFFQQQKMYSWSPASGQFSKWPRTMPEKINDNDRCHGLTGVKLMSPKKLQYNVSASSDPMHIAVQLLERTKIHIQLTNEFRIQPGCIAQKETAEKSVFKFSLAIKQCLSLHTSVIIPFFVHHTPLHFVHSHFSTVNINGIFLYMLFISFYPQSPLFRSLGEWPLWSFYLQYEDSIRCLLTTSLRNYWWFLCCATFRKCSHAWFVFCISTNEAMEFYKFGENVSNTEILYSYTYCDSWWNDRRAIFRADTRIKRR